MKHTNSISTSFELLSCGWWHIRRPDRLDFGGDSILCCVATRAEMAELRSDLVLHLPLCFAHETLFRGFELFDVIFTRTRSILLVLLESRCGTSPKHLVVLWISILSSPQDDWTQYGSIEVLCCQPRTLSLLDAPVALAEAAENPRCCSLSLLVLFLNLKKNK